MAITIEDLKDNDIRQWVSYRRWERKHQLGRIKSWNDSCVFVVYECNEEWDRFQEFIGQETNPEDLTFVIGKRGKITSILGGHAGH